MEMCKDGENQPLLMSASPLPSPAKEPRDLINEVRRQNGWMSVGVLAVIGPLFCWLAVDDKIAAASTLPWLLIGAIPLAAILRRRESCPSCDQNLAFLPGEPRHFGFPELSRQIRCCPFCEVDLAWKGQSGVTGE